MVKLEVADVEHIHDVLVGVFMPFDEHVSATERRDRAMIESALGRPFSTAFGEEVWRTIAEKAAVLFHSLVCNHCFLNGNKRTAVIALDLFLACNKYLLLLSPKDVYELSIEAAVANSQGRSADDVVNMLAGKITEFSVYAQDGDLDQRLRQFGPMTAVNALLRHFFYVKQPTQS